MQGDGTLETRDWRCLQRNFLENHILPWVPSFVSDVERESKVDFYRSISRLARAFLMIEKDLK